MYTRTHVHAHMYTHTCTHAHTCTRTYACTRPCFRSPPPPPLLLLILWLVGTRQRQVVRQILNEGVTFTDSNIAAEIIALQVLLHLIQDYHKRSFRCSTITKEEMMRYFT